MFSLDDQSKILTAYIKGFVEKAHGRTVHPIEYSPRGWVEILELLSKQWWELKREEVEIVARDAAYQEAYEAGAKAAEWEGGDPCSSPEGDR